MGASWIAGVETMSRCVRYQNPVICEYLASQYVAGQMTPRVRRRLQTLIETTPELDRAIARWADSFVEVHEHLPAIDTTIDSESTWQHIEDQLNLSSEVNHKSSSPNFWDQLFVWRITTGIGAFASFALAFILWFSVPTTVIQQPLVGGPSYLANMTSHGDNADNIQFVISAYKKNDSMPASRLHVQWSQAHAGQPERELHLWAEDKDSGQLTYIGIQPPKDEAWNLTKPGWKAIANSRRLLMTGNNQVPTDNNTIFSGLCLQLKAWKT